ncbi:exonuclease V subunit gamma, partial [Cronobacter sakazakii]|nr:exonuclease V subunit gamma [Cronobacter sakazakii]
RTPFDAENFLPARELQSYAREWLPAASDQGEAHPEFIQTLEPEPVEELPFEQLQRFWRHPVRAFFQMRLKVNFRTEESELPDAEPFTLDSLGRYQLNQQLLNTLVEKEDPDLLYRRYRAAGELPYGAFGELFWESQLMEMQTLADRVTAERSNSENLEIDLTLNNVQLTGWLQHVQEDGLLRWRPSLLRVEHGMQLWLEHLVYCASGGTGTSRLYGRKDSQWRF